MKISQKNNKESNERSGEFGWFKLGRRKIHSKVASYKVKMFIAIRKICRKNLQDMPK